MTRLRPPVSTLRLRNGADKPKLGWSVAFDVDDDGEEDTETDEEVGEWFIAPRSMIEADVGAL